MQFSIIVFESLMAALFIVCILHALRRGKQYIIELAVAAVYGVLLEILTMIQFQSYTYSDFLIKIFDAPLAIGLGWAVIIYTAMATVDKLGAAQKARPFMVALLALNIDLSMDAIAIREGFWTWGENGMWFGVPLGNFFAWFIVVFGFSYFIYMLRDARKLQNFYPLLSMVLSLVVLVVLDSIWVYYLTQPTHIFILASMLFFSTSYIHLNKGSLKKDNKFDWEVFSVPFVFHSFFLTLLLVREYRIAPLVMISSLMLVTGLYAHLLPSLNALRNHYNWI
jgi:uncharacterized membrane protein